MVAELKANETVRYEKDEREKIKTKISSINKQNLYAAYIQKGIYRYDNTLLHKMNDGDYDYYNIVCYEEVVFSGLFFIIF